MKKVFLIPVLFFLITSPTLSEGIFPYFFGAKSLAMGTGSRGFNNSINPIYLNPALIGDFGGSITGYQFQNSFRDRDNFEEKLSNILAFNLSDFYSLDLQDKETLVNQIKELNRINNGFWGFSGHFPGIILSDYGISTSVFNSAVINTIKNNNFNKPVSEITQNDIDSVGFKFIGFSFSNISLSYALDLTYDMRIGATFTYINGKYSQREIFITNSLFADTMDRNDYLKEAWSDPKKDIRKLNIDLGANINLGKYFKVAAVMKNANTPKLIDEKEDSKLDRIIIVGMAFKPDPTWEISADIQIAKSKMFMSDEEIQPISFGVEKGFFKNMMFLRAGLLGDISDKYLIGEKSNMIFGLGAGFRAGNFLVNIAAGLDKNGMINSLAVSGFAIIN